MGVTVLVDEGRKMNPFRLIFGGKATEKKQPHELVIHSWAARLELIADTAWQDPHKAKQMLLNALCRQPEIGYNEYENLEFAVYAWIEKRTRDLGPQLKAVKGTDGGDCVS